MVIFTKWWTLISRFSQQWNMQYYKKVVLRADSLSLPATPVPVPLPFSKQRFQVARYAANHWMEQVKFRSEFDENFSMRGISLGWEWQTSWGQKFRKGITCKMPLHSDRLVLCERNYSKKLSVDGMKPYEKKNIPGAFYDWNPNPKFYV